MYQPVGFQCCGVYQLVDVVGLQSVSHLVDVSGELGLRDCVWILCGDMRMCVCVCGCVGVLLLGVLGVWVCGAAAAAAAAAQQLPSGCATAPCQNEDGGGWQVLG